MKVYQCIRAYDLYIPAFENKYGIKESNYSFSELRDLLIADGFAGTYLLKPAFEKNEKEFFFTLWNYKTLQFKWAEENGLKTTNLDEIRLAQIEEFKPDVFYNFSPYYDNKNIEKILDKKELIKVCWDAIIVQNPPFHDKYDLRLTLFEPYVKLWRQHGYNANLLPPAFPVSWENLNPNKKDIDILFYGQYNDYFFSERNSILKEIIRWSKKSGHNFVLHTQFPKQKKPFINRTGIRDLTRWLPVAPRIITNHALEPIYGMNLYETISRSKIVINAFTKFNGHFKDNMRNYESTGCGAFLIGEDGIYPDHFVQEIDFFTYRNSNELIDKIEKVLSMSDQGLEMAKKTREKLKQIYSKENQWNCFVNAINSL